MAGLLDFGMESLFDDVKRMNKRQFFYQVSQILSQIWNLSSSSSIMSN